MRNLAEYPVTKKELLECLKNLSISCDAEQSVGDMRSTLLTVAAHLLKDVSDKAIKDATFAIFGQDWGE